MDELVEEITAVMRPGRSLGMILHRKGGPVFQPDTLYRLVIEVDMGDLDIGSLPHRFRVHAKTVVLRRDLTAARDQVLHRMVQPAMTVMHLESRDAVGQRQQLMPQADTKKRL